jgi:hypothetical protein
MEHWYTSGFFQLSGIPYGSLSCGGCHGPTDADGNPYAGSYAPACIDCHPGGTFDKNALSQDQCLGCHSRQKTEIGLAAYADVHREHGLKCWDCHRASEIHGDGTEYVSVLEAGALKTDCVDCHATLPAGHESNDPHAGALHCSACHTESVISCYSCHFESQVQAGVNRPQRVIDGFVLLVNREKDGKVGTGTFLGVTYEGKSFAAFAPYHGHLVTSAGRHCPACHQNMGGQVEAIAQYNATGRIRLATWDAASGMLDWLRGVIPLPADYASSVSMDFLRYDGDVRDPVALSANWSLVSPSWDGQHMLFGSPLSPGQMEKLGFVLTATDDLTHPGDIALLGIAPNPARDAATIRYRLPVRATVSLLLFDRAGRCVRAIESVTRDAGTYSHRTDARDLPAGMYFCVLEACGQRVVHKLLVLR